MDVASRVRAVLPHFAANRLGGQSVVAFGLKSWGAVASFALSWLIARRFGPAGSGQFGIALSTLTITSYFVLGGLDAIVVRTVAGDLVEGKTAQAHGVVTAVRRMMLFAAPAVALLLFLLRDALAVRVIHEPSMGPVLGVMLWAVVPLTLQKIASGALRGAGRVLLSQLIDGPVGTTFAALGFGVAIVAGAAQSVVLPVGLYVVGVSWGAVAGWWSFRTIARGWPAPLASPVTPLVVAGLPLLASNLSQLFTEWYTTVSLGSHWPLAIVGQYRAAWQFVMLAGMVQLTMEMMIGPRLAAAARIGDTAAIARTARRTIALVLAMASPLFLAIFIFPQLLLSIFGARFVPGALALQILGLGQLARLAAGPLGTIQIMTGHQRWLLAQAIGAVVLCVGFSAWLIPLYGAAGAA
ncbi:MAG: oligosaccharide flippase family protein, partial [Sphingomonadaceae bacterium]|nr:oligosaccharide flippase family protein [Sphingomonadaceae bacterium]